VVAEPARLLSDAEQAALNFMLDADFPGFAELRKQASTARVIGRCDCGCPTIHLAVDRDSSPPALVKRGGMIATANTRGDGFPELLLWLDGDYLSELQLCWLDDYPEEFPPVETLEPPKLSIK
jgi:hypothetical protein